MENVILKTNLEIALRIAITAKERSELNFGYTNDSALLRGWRENLKGLQNGQELKVIYR